MIEKTKIIYKGDMLTGMIFIGLGVLIALTSVLLAIFTLRVGYYYLAIGLAIFSIYSMVKGLMISKVSKSRYNHYLKFNELSEIQAKNEVRYTQYRLDKKEQNRRRYAWTFVIAALIGVTGIFMQEQGLIIGTIIPIVLFAAIEFAVGLLVEFRLWEYQRRLYKSLGMEMDE